MMRENISKAGFFEQALETLKILIKAFHNHDDRNSWRYHKNVAVSMPIFFHKQVKNRKCSILPYMKWRPRIIT